MTEAMEALLTPWHGERLIIHFDQPTGAWIIVAIHSTQLGPAIGGTRMKPYETKADALADALKLSEGMTYKNAAAGLAWGGGKAVIALTDDLTDEQRTGLLLRHGALIKDLNGLYWTGPDVGTSPEDMPIIAETAGRYVFGRPDKVGNTGLFTAYGILAAIEVTLEHLFDNSNLEDRRILVQGAGHVGGELIKLLCQAGADVLFTDIDEDTIRHYRDTVGATYIKPENVYTTLCDIFAPCALGGSLNRNTIRMLPTRAVVGSANNQLETPEDATRLMERGILYAPDFVVNVGGAIALTGIDIEGWSREEAIERVIGSVRTNLPQVFNIAEERGITTEAAARLLAETRLKRNQ